MTSRRMEMITRDALRQLVREAMETKLDWMLVPGVLTSRDIRGVADYIFDRLDHTAPQRGEADSYPCPFCATLPRIEPTCEDCQGSGFIR
jgi:hypothetical protein